MEVLDTDLLDNFLHNDYDLPANIFEDEFMLEEETTLRGMHSQLTDELLAIRGIREELESLGSSPSLSPTFSSQTQNVSPGSDSDEELKASHPVEIQNRDTPSPGSSSSSSGCYSDDTNGFPGMSPVSLQSPPHQVANGFPMQFVQMPMVQSPPVQMQPKTLILPPEDFEKLMRNLKANKQPPSIQTVVQPAAVATSVRRVSVPAPAAPMPVVKAKPIVPATAPKQIATFCLPSNQLIDEKTLRKQQRLIKNRESANLSRKKKKDFVDSLQEQIQQLGQEKENLMQENHQLRTQLLNNLCSRCGQSVQEVHLKGGNNRKTVGYVTKKNSMVVLAMILTVSLNFGPINNMLSSPQSPIVQPASPDDGQLRRHILWAADDPLKGDSSAESRNITKRSVREAPLPIVNITSSSSNCGSTDTGDQQHQYINQTENIRIASELHRWIGEPEYLNVTKRPRRLRSLFPSLDVTDDEVAKDFEYDGNFLVNLMPKKYLKNRKLQLRKSKKMDKNSLTSGKRAKTVMGEVDVFSPRSRSEMKYAELFEELRRRDDTFYVVSFNADHLLLPAMAYNKTKRPKMSLMFPAVGFNGSISEDHIMMMQIDCEVLDTSMIQVKEKLIPDHLRRFPNGTETTNGQPEGDDVDVNVRDVMGKGERNVTEEEFGPKRRDRGGRVAQKPFFVGNPRFGNISADGG